MTMKKLLIFAGTSEGRFLIDIIRGKAILTVRTATDYGKELLPESDETLTVSSGRMNLEEMIDLMRKGNFDCVIDTTHPYAQIVTENIIAAAEETETKYIRFLRGQQPYPKGVILVDSMDEAVDVLNEKSGNILMTLGSKELGRFTSVKDYEERIYARVLPMESVLTQCVEQGFKGKRLICMQGPFSKDMNKALIRHSSAKILVTKDTGKVGGFGEKLEAALEEGIEVLVVGRPTDEKGYSMKSLLSLLSEEYGLSISFEDLVKAEEFEEFEELSNVSESDKEYCDYEKTTYESFPIFIDSGKKNILLIGLGKIGMRRLKSLIKFNFNNITIVEPKDIKEIVNDNKDYDDLAKRVDFVNEHYDKAHLDRVDENTIVIAATDDTKLNEEICKEALKKTKFVNSVSDKNLCSFYFPGLALKDDVVVGVTAQGKNHKLAKDVTLNIRKFLGEKDD